MTTVLDTGCHAASLAAKSARVDVVAAYPITPQTSIVEAIAEMIEKEEIQCRFLPVEGEHSSMAACAAAAAAGARVFTATASQGLLYMHENLHMVSGGRLPMVMVNVNRAIFSPWALLVDHQDSLSQRDTGWLQIYASSVQEIYNAVIQGYRIAELAQLPVMVNFDGFILSHSATGINIPDQEIIDRYLPPFEPEWRLDTANPTSFANVTLTEYYAKHRASLQKAQEESRPIIKQAAEEYRELTGMWNGDFIETYRMEDADLILVSMGSMADESKVAVDVLRDEGKKAGAVRIRVYRPFPIDELLQVFPANGTLVVFDRDYAFGMRSGILAIEIKAALYGRSTIPVHSVVAGIGGEDVTWRAMADTAAGVREAKS